MFHSSQHIKNKLRILSFYAKRKNSLYFIIFKLNHNLEDTEKSKYFYQLTVRNANSMLWYFRIFDSQVCQLLCLQLRPTEIPVAFQQKKKISHISIFCNRKIN